MTDISFIKLVIFEAQGKQVYNSNMNPINNNIKFYPSNKSSGLYFIKGITGKRTNFKSFTIQK